MKGGPGARRSPSRGSTAGKEQLAGGKASSCPKGTEERITRCREVGTVQWQPERPVVPWMGRGQGTPAVTRLHIPARRAWRSRFSCMIFSSSSRERASSSSSRRSLSCSTERKKLDTSSDMADASKEYAQPGCYSSTRRGAADMTRSRLWKLSGTDVAAESERGGRATGCRLSCVGRSAKGAAGNV